MIKQSLATAHSLSSNKAKPSTNTTLPAVKTGGAFSRPKRLHAN